MKSVVLTMVGVLIGVYTLISCFGIYSLAVRENALDEHVSRVLLRTLEREYGNTEEEAVKAALIEELASEEKTNSRIEVEVKYLDLKKGIIQVLVQEYFHQVNGKERVISCEKTVLLDAKVNTMYHAGVQEAVMMQRSGTQEVYQNAQLFYEQNQGTMIFKPDDGTEAGVFYGTQAKNSSTGKIVFETLGWRVTVKNKEGEIMDQVYYALDGQHIRIADERTVDGYRYNLYNISLKALKGRLSAEANEALKKADCSILFDACIVVKKNGVRQGGMTDEGIAWGTVHTTYDGIVNAASWSSKTKKALLNYFDKEIADMFYTVDLSCGTGIAEVYGAGKYCYGTEITIDAATQSGYSFLEWTGQYISSNQHFSFTVKEDVSLRATTTRNQVAVNLYRNLDSRDTCVETQYFAFDAQPKNLTRMTWSKTGHYQSGWSTSRIIAQPYFGVGDSITEEWLEMVAPSVDLYATWEPNNYQIIYVGTEAQEGNQSVQRKYTGQLLFPSEGFTFTDGELTGWSLSPEGQGRVFACGETISMAELAALAGVEEEDGEVIYLYPFREKTMAFLDNIRFFSGKYYKDDQGDWISPEKGGLSEQSIWRHKEEYERILDEIFRNE